MNSLHFALGPVQTFVAQARRTRDFWAGSFLLSYLAGQAMTAVEKAKGEIVFPVVTDPSLPAGVLLASIRATQKGQIDEGPSIGVLPNRFQAKVPSTFRPEVCQAAVQTAWERIAEAVWQQYVAPVAQYGQGTRAIWDEQVKNFWEITWVYGDNPALLDRRKNWRSHLPPVGEGEICSIMPGLQEISGYIRSRERQQQERFWQALRARVPELELRDGERLSAIALIKRLFPWVAKEAIGWAVPGYIKSFPSTSDLAVYHWKAKMRREHPEWLKQYLEIWGKDTEGGTIFFRSNLENDLLWEEGTKEKRRQMVEVLKNLDTEPSPFYAVLRMDGDRMGALLGKNRALSQALSHFSRQVLTIVERHHGSMVYAGGDDVLALFPLEDALPAAVDLRRAYMNAFQKIKGEAGGGRATISAAIVYAHHHAPLKAVLAESQTILEEKAKEESGRDSLAITVWKTRGRVLSWAAPWERIIVEEKEQDVISELAQEFAQEKKTFSSSFFFNLRARFSLLTSPEKAGEAEEDNSLSELELRHLLVAEYSKSREIMVKREEAEARIEKLIQICQKAWRDESGQIRTIPRSLDFDGVLLVRFLATKGVDNR